MSWGQVVFIFLVFLFLYIGHKYALSIINFSGRLSRSRFFIYWLIAYLVGNFLLDVSSENLESGNTFFGIISWIGAIFFKAIEVSSIAKRLQDIGYSGKWAIGLFVFQIMLGALFEVARNFYFGIILTLFFRNQCK